MKLSITHHTRYDYDREVSLHPHLLFIRPRETPLQTVESFTMGFEPHGRVNWMRDEFDNFPASVHFDQSARALDIKSSCLITTADVGPFEFLVRDYAANFPFQYEPLHRFNLGIYLRPPKESTRNVLDLWLQRNFLNRPSDTISAIFALNQVVQCRIGYQRREEPGIQTADTTLAKGFGTCRDFAALLIECLRHLGLAARFVSGYLFDPLANASAPGDMHAWVEVFIPGAGWRGLDPTHGIFCDNAYIPVAHAVVAESVNPVQGSFFSAPAASSRLSSNVHIQRLD